MKNELRIKQESGRGWVKEFVVIVAEPSNVCICVGRGEESDDGSRTDERIISFYEVDGKKLYYVESMSVQYLKNNSHDDIKIGEELYDEDADEIEYEIVLDPVDIESILIFLDEHSE